MTMKLNKKVNQKILRKKLKLTKKKQKLPFIIKKKMNLMNLNYVTLVISQLVKISKFLILKISKLLVILIMENLKVKLHTLLKIVNIKKAFIIMKFHRKLNFLIFELMIKALKSTKLKKKQKI